MSRCHSAHALAAWKAIAAAEPVGLLGREVYAAARQGATDKAMSGALQYMKALGYLRFEGCSLHGRWHVGMYVPYGIDADPSRRCPADAPPVKAPVPAVQGIPAGVPNSVWQLGMLMSQEGPSCA